MIMNTLSGQGSQPYTCLTKDSLILVSCLQQILTKKYICYVSWVIQSLCFHFTSTVCSPLLQAAARSNSLNPNNNLIILVWPKSSFGFFCKNFLANPIHGETSTENLSNSFKVIQLIRGGASVCPRNSDPKELLLYHCTLLPLTIKGLELVQLNIIESMWL